MTVLLNGCRERDLAGVEELFADLAVQGPLVCFHRQEEVGPLLRELPKNGFCVWSASGWIKTPSRSMVESSSRRTARSWFSRVSNVAWAIAAPRALE